MEKLLFLNVLLPSFLLQFYPVLILSEPYVFPDKYFINCGSSSSVKLGSRNFVGDKNPNSFRVEKGKPVEDTSQSVGLSLYQTARFHTSPFSYNLNITKTGLHVVRLHFFPFMSGQVNLVDALFNVSASRKSLVSNFSVRNSSFPVIKDFWVPINSTSFRIHFIPAQQTSFAFVNAIEVFLIPDLVDDRTLVTTAGSPGNYLGLPSQVLRTVQRVNVGGRPLNDPTAIASEWVADDDYIFVGNLAKNCSYFSGRLNYDDNIGAFQNFVPDLVYKTCKEVDLTNNQTSNSANITWHFNVSKNARHLVRVHFCDIISPSPNVFNFNLFIYGRFSQNINPYEYTVQTAVPFYYDFVVDSGDSDFISISVVTLDGSLEKIAYLNGLEIMEFITEPGLKLGGSEPKKKPVLFIITGSVVGVFVICSLIVVFLLCKKGIKRKPFETMASYGTLPFGGASPYVGISTKSVNPPPVPNLNLKLKMPFAEIIEATINFEAKLLVGEGGFGKVYKGTLRNGLKVAVKRSESKHGQGLPEFQTEVMCLPT
ncbi:Malectin-like domain - like 2 [Theobroma cacao]|nr:Malectin-like domain - like 2 [Theobroma cacao]